MTTPTFPPPPIGTLTNFGTLTHYDEAGFAHFVSDEGRAGWLGCNAFNLIQVRSYKGFEFSLEPSFGFILYYSPNLEHECGQPLGGHAYSLQDACDDIDYMIEVHSGLA